MIPLPLRQLLQRKRNQGYEVPEKWYLPTEFFDRMGEDAAQLERATADLWPEGAEYAFVLTHDVETERGLGIVPRLAEIEESLGFRSSWNVVPHLYPIDEGLLRDLQDRGFEIGVHGYNHDGRLFTTRGKFRSRLSAMNHAMARWQATGFRSPMAHRNLEWMQELDAEYDTSCFDVDPFQAMPGGVGSLWPFTVGRLVELPYTLPQDHTLFVALGETTDRIWREKLGFIRKHRGMALALTHPDYLDTKALQDLYRGFLEHVRESGGFWHALPRDVARWWRDRPQAEP